ncbi:hypothetical protein E3N88_05983 [Mikania micrantha]|uniref:Integrase catalytic domain-containing protein n=1 Tax=Mikania micrantha TaxID=192012 RepID=A0A5N6PPL0_9ASTR|nr:hypothetical protein E3N88_05983 [Mikania micrantha]
MSSSSSNNDPIPLSNMLAIKLSPTNYLYWVNQMKPLLRYHNLYGHVDGTVPAPPMMIAKSDKESAENPAYLAWLMADQRAIILLNASLTEDAISISVGLPTARDIWVALEAAFCTASTEREQNLKDQLRLIHKGNMSVAEYSRSFKAVSDQLHAIGKPMDHAELLHLFLRGLGLTFEPFSASVRLITPLPSFSDIVAKAESHELFMKSMQGLGNTSVAFQAHTSSNSSHNYTPPSSYNRNNQRGRGQYRPRFNPSNMNNNRPRRTPTCQLCRKPGHYAPACPKLPSNSAPTSEPVDDNLVRAFHAQCSVSGPDWYVDSGASDHMSTSSENINNATKPSGNKQVFFGNGHTLGVTKIGDTNLFGSLKLNNVLVVPNLTKNLLSVGKLTEDNDVDVLFSHPYFYIQDRRSRQVLAQGRREDGLYVLHNKHEALVASSSCPKASYEVWHSRLGHASLNIITMLKQFGCLSFTSILPKPGLCSSCELAKAKRLPFDNKMTRALNPLDLIHCDLWGPAPVKSVDNFVYYVVFIDDFSRFSWLYPLHTKSEFFDALSIFVTFVQTQFSRKIKVFQSDGGTEFVNHRVRKLFEQNGTLHRLSCPYTPQQNGRAERKHRHIIETGLAMMFNAQMPSAYWVDAFSSAMYIINRLPTALLGNKSPFQLLYDKQPNYSGFRTFGCLTYPLLRDYAPNKLAPRSLPCVFIGYSAKYKGFKCLDLTTSRVYVTRHARFDENIFPLANPNSSTPASSLKTSTFLDLAYSKYPTNIPTKPAATHNATPPVLHDPLLDSLLQNTSPTHHTNPPLHNLYAYKCNL